MTTGAELLRALRRSTGPAPRRSLAALAWIVGAVGGAAPVAFVGDPPAGLLAGAVLGAAAWWWTAPLVATPWVAAVVGRDDETGAAARLHLAGIGYRRRLALRSVGAGLDVVAVTRWAAVAGVVAAAGTGRGRPPELLGRSAPHVEGIAAGLGLLVAAVVAGALLAVVARGAAPAVVAWAAAVALTGSVISAATLVPALRPAVPLQPWVALWPFDPDDVLAPTLALEVPVPTRMASLLAWSAALAVLGRHRRRHHPYPGGDHGGRRPRHRRSRP